MRTEGDHVPARELLYVATIMPPSRIAFLLLALPLALPACAADVPTNPPPPDPRATLANATPDQQMRLVGAALGEDIELAKWLSYSLLWRTPSCAITTYALPDITFDAGPSGCADRLSFAGKEHVVSPQGLLGNWTSVTFDHLHIDAGGTTNVTLDGTLSWTYDAQGLELTEVVELDATRGTITVHTSEDADGKLTVGIDGLGVATATVDRAAGKVTLTGKDQLSYVSGATPGCGTATAGGKSSDVCPWLPGQYHQFADPTFPLRHVAATCDSNGGTLSFVMNAPDHVRAYISGMDYDIGGAAWDDAQQAYVVTVTDSDCNAAHAVEAVVDLDDGSGTVHEDRELLGNPSTFIAL